MKGKSCHRYDRDSFFHGLFTSPEPGGALSGGPGRGRRGRGLSGPVLGGPRDRSGRGLPSL